jgi:hypothetical protein
LRKRDIIFLGRWFGLVWFGLVCVMWLQAVAICNVES